MFADGISPVMQISRFTGTLLKPLTRESHLETLKNIGFC